MVTQTKLYDPTLDIWPELRFGQIVLQVVRVGMDRSTGKVLVGWNHVLQSMDILFHTPYHERVLRRWVGSFVPHILGENAVERTITKFYWSIASSLDLWEPCYSIDHITVQDKPPQITDAGPIPLTSVDELRQGTLSTITSGVYKPRGHLGDPTPEDRRSSLLRGSSVLPTGR